MHVCAKGDQAHMCVLWHPLQGLCDGKLACCKLILRHACVNEEEVHRWVGCCDGGDCVFDGAAARVQLSGEIGVRDALVVGGEVVAAMAEGTDPDLAVVVHTSIGVEDCRALLAGDGLVWEHLGGTGRGKLRSILVAVGVSDRNRGVSAGMRGMGPLQIRPSEPASFARAGNNA